MATWGPVFFLISGFVIFMSIQNRSIVEFCIARIARLYPAYWAALMLTAIVIFFWGGDRFSVQLGELFVNISMLQTFLMVELVDGVYWSLAHELVFYFWMAVILFFGVKDKFLLIGVGFFLFSSLAIFVDIPRPVRLILLIQYSPYFISGALFFLCYRDGFSVAKCVVLAWGVLLAVHQVVHQFVWVEVHFNADWNVGIAVGIVLFFFIIFFFLIVYGYKIRIKYAAFLGALTYPLYLVHQNIGYIIFQRADGRLADWVILILVTVLVLLSSWAIHFFVEKRFGLRLKMKLTSFNKS